MQVMRRLSLNGLRPLLVVPRPHSSWICMSCAPLQAASRFAATAAAPQKGPNYYKRLEVSTDATPQEIKAAYRRLALQCHPDVVEDTRKGVAEAQFRAVSEAYEVLSDPQQRRAHDARLGVKPARKPTKAPAPAEEKGAAGAQAPPQPPSYSRMYGTSNYRDEADDAAERQQHAARARMAGARRRRNYVRRDADRAFADAFDGKTLDQVIFEARRRKRVEAAQKATQASVSAHKGTSSSSGSVREAPAGREETMRRVMEHASETFAEGAAKQYGHGILQHVRVYQRHPFRQAAAPPGRYMPFRPFRNWEVPDGVATPTLKLKEPACHVSEVAESCEPTYMPPASSDDALVRPLMVPEFKLEDGTVMPRNYGLTRLQRNVRGMAHNMGQLYSYHRPY
ncbi:chaperone protein DNAJ [Strigomonas culicis]|uniref:Chaperone protein DNAJ n=1 Tax=Strigomonas culicis TaxID=28005 RepID=S9TWW9_9TRYP|nr:chaperone protein DNAJ [Strigomonas culicis]|eukprot:EPY22992.1 chaperone protein DNAJ [Strigomonas culicis]